MKRGQSLKEFLADPRRQAVEAMAEAQGIPDGERIPAELWRECGYSEDELRDLGLTDA